MAYLYLKNNHIFCKDVERIILNMLVADRAIPFYLDDIKIYNNICIFCKSDSSRLDFPKPERFNLTTQICYSCRYHQKTTGVLY